jgi:2-desacetyl-2-hydroxyethyl bacteriochlorophyllide A dehydrogenase
MSRLQIGDAVVVTGAGPIGLLMAMVARAAGAAQVIITEVSPTRIAGAKKMGFTVLDATADNLVEQLLELTRGRGGDIVFEATGHPSVAPYLMDLARIRGQIVQVGIFKQPVPIDLRALNFHEVDLIGARVYTMADYEQTISLAAQQKFDLKSIDIQMFSPDEAVTAFASAREATAVKTMFEIEA